LEAAFGRPFSWVGPWKWDQINLGTIAICSPFRAQFCCDAGIVAPTETIRNLSVQFPWSLKKLSRKNHV
jgi:hypothetical protein